MSASDPLAVVKVSPELVGRHDRASWLALFTPDAVIEDPVGADRYEGSARHGPFWDAFIAPNRVTFHPRRELVSGDLVVRYVTISSITPVSDTPFELPAIIEYRVRGDRIASLRAFWEPHLAVSWHLRQGAKGIFGLSKHGLRMTTGLGLGSAMGFSRALMPSLGKAEGRALAERLAGAIGGSRAEWLALVGAAELDVASPSGGEALRDPSEAWEAAIAGAGPRRVDEVIVAGDHLACVLGGDRAVAAIARVAKGELRSLRVLFEVCEG